MINISEVISVCRKRNGWSQKELAEKAGVNYACVWRCENGVNVPLFTTVEYLLEAMGYELRIVRKEK